MLLNDVHDALVESMLDGEIHSLFHVRNDDQCAHRRRQIVMWISLEAHIFREVIGFYEFADVMKIRADTTERCIRTDGFRRGFGEIGYDKAMVIGARCFYCHATQQWVIEI